MFLVFALLKKVDRCQINTMKISEYVQSKKNNRCKNIHIYIYICVCVCVCVRAVRGQKGAIAPLTFFFFLNLIY